MRYSTCTPTLHLVTRRAAGPGALLSAAQLDRMAAHYTRSLCDLKHYGAIDKTQQGFALLCQRCLWGGLRRLSNGGGCRCAH